MVGTGGNNGSASVSPSTSTNRGTLTGPGITQTNSGYSGQLLHPGDGLQRDPGWDKPRFSVAPSVAVQDGPENGLINSGE